MTETAEQRAERIQRYIDKTHQRFVDSLSLNMPEINTSVMCGPVKAGNDVVTFDAEWVSGVPIFPSRSLAQDWE